MEIVINVDSLIEGIVHDMSRFEKVKDIRGIIIGTDGKLCPLSAGEVKEILFRLEGCEQKRATSIGDYVGIFSQRSVMKLEGDEYLVGDMMVLKYEKGTTGPVSFTRNDVVKAIDQFRSRLAVLVCADKSFSAYEIRD